MTASAIFALRLAILPAPNSRGSGANGKGSSSWTSQASPRGAATRFARRRVLQLGVGAVASLDHVADGRAQTIRSSRSKRSYQICRIGGRCRRPHGDSKSIETHLGEPLVIDNRPGPVPRSGTRAVSCRRCGRLHIVHRQHTDPRNQRRSVFNAGDDLSRALRRWHRSAGSAFIWSFIRTFGQDPSGIRRLRQRKSGQIDFGFGIGTHPHVIGEHFKITN